MQGGRGEGVGGKGVLKIAVTIIRVTCAVSQEKEDGLPKLSVKFR